MGRFAVLFLIVGLAVGLWLGFNPAAHREVVRLWDRSRVTQTSSRPSGLVDVRRFNASVNRWLRTVSRPQPTPAPERTTVPTGPQISAELQAFWNALQRIWLNFIARIRGTASS